MKLKECRYTLVFGSCLLEYHWVQDLVSCDMVECYAGDVLGTSGDTNVPNKYYSLWTCYLIVKGNEKLGKDSHEKIFLSKHLHFLKRGI